MLFEESDRKLRCGRHHFSEMTAELEMVSAEVRARRLAKLDQDGTTIVDGALDRIRRIVRQRDVLKYGAIEIAEMRLEWMQ